MVWVTLSLNIQVDLKVKIEVDEHLLQLMGEVHVEGEETVKIFNQTKCKISLVNKALKSYLDIF